MSICDEDYDQASEYYKQVFTFTVKPYGKDAYNAALVGAISGDKDLRDHFLQLIINNSDDLSYVQSQLVNKYITIQNWYELMVKKSIDYNKELSDEMSEITLHSLEAEIKL